MTVDLQSQKRAWHADIAVVGMALRFPGADSPGEFWANLENGVESISFYTESELLNAGVPPDFIADRNYIKAGGFPRDFKSFDPEFFGISGREAELMDPQHRLALECAWEALEHAGCDPARYPGKIGVFAGVAPGDHRNYVLSNLGKFNFTERFLARFGNDHDFLSTRISYKLNLRGPALTIQTACSTSLVAAHMACRSLQLGESDMCIAGGISIDCLDLEGYFYLDGAMLSPDGHCRAFDADAKGTVFTNGGGFVVLKRVEDALRDRDTIYAVIKGSAINNDGNAKVGFFAPSVEGQAEVIAAALKDGGIQADSISYVEAHGTGTELGDPVEIAALTRVFREQTSARQFCAVGSVKTNVGHLNTAAGASGLIKTCLALHHKKIPPTLHFAKPNPHIDFSTSPFYVNSSLTDWAAREGPRRAGVTALGVGGTNAHIVLEEAPPPRPLQGSPSAFLIPVSARDSESLQRVRSQLSGYLRRNPEISVADVAYTLQMGRSHLGCRASFVVDASTATLTRSLDSAPVDGKGPDAGTVFLLTGSGVPDGNAVSDLYADDVAFRDDVNRCLEIYRERAGIDLLIPEFRKGASPVDSVHVSTHADVLRFAFQYALANMLFRWNVRPAALLAYGTGEHVAAVLAGVFDLKTAIALLECQLRGKQGLPRGRMIEVPRESADLFQGSAFFRCYETDRAVGVVGDRKAVDLAVDRLVDAGVPVRLLGEHPMLEPAAIELIQHEALQLLSGIHMTKPGVPVVSGWSGRWWNEEGVLDAQYWVQQIGRSVEIGKAMEEVQRNFPSSDFAQLGPSKWLDTGLATVASPRTWSTILHGKPGSGVGASAYRVLLEITGRAWERGAAIDWRAMAETGGGRKIALPTYPFNRRPIWFHEESAAHYETAAKSEGFTKGPVDADLPGMPEPVEKGRLSSRTDRPKVQIGNAITGKGSLPAPQARNAEGTVSRAAHGSVVEELVELCKGILKVPAVNQGQTFLECGGDSIRATQFIWAIEKKFGARLEIDDVLDTSLSNLASLLKPSPASRGLGDATLAAICQICEDSLKIPSVNGAQSFLDCGGDSIRATQFIWMVEKRFSTKLDIEDVLTLSLRDLAAVIDRAGPPGSIAAANRSQVH